MLARLGSSCKLRPQAATVEDVSDLFVLLEPVRTLGEALAVPSQSPTRQLLDTVSRHVRQLMAERAALPSFVPWESHARVLMAAARWPHTVWFPPSLWGVDAEGVRRDWVAYGGALLCSGGSEEDLVQQLDHVFPRRSEQEFEEYAWDVAEATRSMLGARITSLREAVMLRKETDAGDVNVVSEESAQE